MISLSLSTTSNIILFQQTDACLTRDSKKELITLLSLAPPSTLFSLSPNKANMNMNKKSRNSSERMDEMAFIRAITKLRSEDQYLEIIVRRN